MVAGLMALALAACSDDDAGSDQYAFGTAAPAAAPDPAGLEPLLLTLEDIPLPGWVTQPPSDDDPTVDDETGGICALEFTDVLTPEQQATEQGRTFVDGAGTSALQEYLWAAPGAEALVASVAAELAACSGAYDGTSDDSTVVMTSGPIDLTMPGATVSVCRSYQAVLNGETAMNGTICLGATGDRFMGVMASTVDPAGGGCAGQHGCLHDGRRGEGILGLTARAVGRPARAAVVPPRRPAPGRRRASISSRAGQDKGMRSLVSQDHPATLWVPGMGRHDPMSGARTHPLRGAPSE